MEQDNGLGEVFRIVLEREGIDLSSYRRQTVERRVNSRLQKIRCESYGDYASRLADDPDESRRLVEHVTIKVSSFFRDAPVYAKIREDVLPDLMCSSNPKDELRIWSAGCGYGEEAYSLAILLQEIAAQRRSGLKWSILGTDVDESALATARNGVYSQSALAETSPELRESYFTPHEGRFGFQYELKAIGREGVKFLRHDLLSETVPPCDLGFDLILCRNVLIYFSRLAQERILAVLTDSIVPGGYLCLGEAEQLPRELHNRFETVDRSARLYRKGLAQTFWPL